MTPEHAPSRVRTAFILLWASFTVSLIEGVVTQLVSESFDASVEVAMWSFLLVASAAGAYFIYAASRRHNWARIILLVITLVVIAAYVVWPLNWTEEPWWSTAIIAICTAADLIALFWLFSGEGRRWYAMPASG